ncbi:unnamed protein product [Echinostoma caproni]|uniref:RING-type domain-containing protein n=1 Tax=Echinostoma caproni TaxID=27848 RepID=A0A183AGK5_9TREM|nr:unnamed protein product [Echinostoma caproni]
MLDDQCDSPEGWNSLLDGDLTKSAPLEESTGLPTVCGICEKPFVDPVILNCLHIFDRECLRSFEKHDNVVSYTKCPRCEVFSGSLKSLEPYDTSIVDSDVSDDLKRLSLKTDGSIGNGTASTMSGNPNGPLSSVSPTESQGSTRGQSIVPLQIAPVAGNGHIDPFITAQSDSNVVARPITNWSDLSVAMNNMDHPDFLTNVPQMDPSFLGTQFLPPDMNQNALRPLANPTTMSGLDLDSSRVDGLLWYPRKVAIIRQSQRYVVCDRGNERSRMQLFSRSGHFVRRIPIRYIDIVAGLAINQHGHIVAIDSVSPSVFVVSEEGDLIRWFDCSNHMREPSDVAIHGREYYICDFKAHCVIVFQEDGTFIRRIGGESITDFPNGIDVSDHGDVLVGDSHGNRFHIAVFSRTGELLSEFVCNQTKVSRSCCLKITTEGYVVTLARSSNNVLVLDTLYIC